MPKGTGFGKVEPRKPQANHNKTKRAAAAQKFDEMKRSGLPEFNIFVRVKGQSGWLPAGVMAVDRSNKIGQAIYQNEAELREGAFRLYPRLRKQQANLEYGYQLKQYPDEPIALAEPPKPVMPNPLAGMLARAREVVAQWLPNATSR